MFKSIKIYSCLWSKKKVLIMPINFTIKLIQKTAKLKVKKISNIEKLLISSKIRFIYILFNLIIFDLTFLV